LHQTVLEVVGYEPGSDCYVVASGWGTQANWFQNIQFNPQVMVQVGNQCFAAQAERLSIEEATRSLLGYAHRHPLAFRELGGLITGRTLGLNESACRSLALVVPLIALHLLELLPR
jgi:deazaflavin-dependent oxidoreductase (nitroreductase family)